VSEGAKVLQLQDFCRIVQGGRLGLSGNDFVPNGFPAYGAGGLNGYLPEYEFDEPAVVLSAIGARCGKCFYADGKWTSLANTQLIFPDPAKADAKFLWYQLNDEARWHRSGTGQPFIKPADVKTHRVYLPPLPEQRRIAAILDKADELRAKRRAALKKLDELTQSIFLDMFGDPATNPKGWLVKQIGEITQCLDRFRRPVTESDRKQGRVPYYGANGQQGWIDKALFNEPLVLVAEDGGYFDAPERGVAYRIDGPAWVNNHAHVLRAIPDYIETEFLHRALRRFNFLPYISGTTRAKLTQGQLNSVKLFVPPLNLQVDFCKRVATIENLTKAASLSCDRLATLFASLQHRAFRGELNGAYFNEVIK
jgi:restriction endonuclease S subunit